MYIIQALDLLFHVKTFYKVQILALMTIPTIQDMMGGTNGEDIKKVGAPTKSTIIRTHQFIFNPYFVSTKHFYFWCRDHSRSDLTH